MITVYDLFLNFQEVAFDFFEWTKQDSIEHFKKIPLVRVNTETVLDFLKKDVQVTKDFLKEIYRLTEKYDLTRLEYACLFSDGKMVLAVEFSKDGYSIYKSRVLLEDEDEIVQYAKQEQEIEMKYQVIGDSVLNETFFTRKERKVKNFLEKEILKSFELHEQSKLQYLFLEYFDEVEDDLLIMKTKLLNSMKCSLNQKHFNLYELLLLLSKKKKVKSDL